MASIVFLLTALVPTVAITAHVARDRSLRPAMIDLLLLHDLRGKQIR